MKFVVDMNLTPEWCPVLQQGGWEAIHWSSVGDPRATDVTIMSWARTQGRVVFTHDLDLGAILAVTRAMGPSVVQARTQDTLPSYLAPILVPALREYEPQLEKGAILVVDEARSRVRLLPLG